MLKIDEAIVVLALAVLVICWMVTTESFSMQLHIEGFDN